MFDSGPMVPDPDYEKMYKNCHISQTTTLDRASP
jgi:hypothetical protein